MIHKLKASVIIATHKEENIGLLTNAVKSISNQTYRNTEVIIVVDNNLKLYNLLREFPDRFANLDIRVLLNNAKRGLSPSRNVGIMNSSGDIVCFMDDDAEADKHWVEELVKTYEQYLEVCGVGGPILPLGKVPWWLAEEFQWLIGVTPEAIYGSKVVEVRNTFGSNSSFRREVFERVGLFNDRLGISGKDLLQAEETEFCVRCMRTLNKKIIYNPRAIVYHRVLPHRLRLSYLARRAFKQGLSKAMLSSVLGNEVLSVERKFLVGVLRNSVKRVLTIKGLTQSALATLLTASVAMGFMYGKAKNVIELHT